MHHGAGLRRLLSAAKLSETEQDLLLKALETDHTNVSLAPLDSAILDYAVKLTATPKEMTAADVDELRDNGLNDRGIHDVCAITAYFNFVNRMADGLGVELES
ncbi:MAG: putative peroxidase-related enzyme [Candidatus Krumholzibacteriia bacterium]